ncbi:Protein EXORDIUM-like 1 [Hibiscus syriacus]|uniref:Protein EXORDIUM-like 1 n=1 Tax=Hibiscus syriacus TaxID=106335 RepID=A0A6A2XAY2_HIBSY|nr:Protein EXORDIUM-like 1 [Hibiscus syriacus]
MASLDTSNVVLFLLVLVSSLYFTAEARKLVESDETEQPLLFQYHNGPLLSGKISVNLIWYGKFKPSQRAIVSDFIASVASSKPTVAQPSVATWWKATEKYYQLTKRPSSLDISLGSQILDDNYSLGKSLMNQQIVELGSKGAQKNAINVVLTSADVAVDGFCSSRCGTHGSALGSSSNGHSNSLISGSNPPLVAPNNDVGLDGMVINIASLLAGTVTNPFGNGYYQGPKEAPLEAASACPGIYGKRAYPGYAGHHPVDATTGASYNAHGVNGRKYLLPALFDPTTSNCATLA